jgi:hypothetical protein
MIDGSLDIRPSIGYRQRTPLVTLSRRWLAAASLVALWVAAPLWAMVHAATERHGYCAKHGAIEEHAAAPAGGARTAIPAVLPAAPADTEHEVCSFSPFSDGTARLGCQPVALVALAPMLPAPRSFAAMDPPAPVPLLAFAPKSSPPLSL